MHCWYGLENSISDCSFRFSFEPAAKCKGHSVMFWANVRRKRDPAVHEIIFILGSRVSMFSYTSDNKNRHLTRSFLKSLENIHWHGSITLSPNIFSVIAHLVYIMIFLWVFLIQILMSHFFVLKNELNEKVFQSIIVEMWILEAF